MSHHKQLFLILSFTALTAFADNKKQEFLYNQLLPKIVTLDIENPTEEALHAIQIGQAYLQGGTKFKPAVTEIWQAICSIDLFSIISKHIGCGCCSQSLIHKTISKTASSIT